MNSAVPLHVASLTISCFRQFYVLKARPRRPFQEGAEDVRGPCGTLASRGPLRAELQVVTPEHEGPLLPHAGYCASQGSVLPSASGHPSALLPGQCLRSSVLSPPTPARSYLFHSLWGTLLPESPLNAQSSDNLLVRKQTVAGHALCLYHEGVTTSALQAQSVYMTEAQVARS